MDNSDEPALIDVVDRWPAQESSIHLARVPTAVLYDEKGNVSIPHLQCPYGYRVDVQLVAARQLLACGAEAVAASAGDERYLQGQLEHFKMQLHPTFNPSAKKFLFQSS